MGGKNAATASNGMKGVNQLPHAQLKAKDEQQLQHFHTKVSYVRSK